MSSSVSYRMTKASRSTAATLLLGRGINPKIVSEMLGHSQIGITLNTYSHVLPNMQKDAATALDRMLGVAPVVTPSASGTRK